MRKNIAAVVLALIFGIAFSVVDIAAQYMPGQTSTQIVSVTKLVGLDGAPMNFTSVYMRDMGNENTCLFMLIDDSNGKVYGPTIVHPASCYAGNRQ